MKKALHALFERAHALGAVGTHIADVAIFGTRRNPDRPASRALPRATPDDSIGLHSVWQGPKMIPGGAPLVRRNKIA